MKIPALFSVLALVLSASAHAAALPRCDREKDLKVGESCVSEGSDFAADLLLRHPALYKKMQAKRDRGEYISIEQVVVRLVSESDANEHGDELFTDVMEYQIRYQSLDRTDVIDSPDYVLSVRVTTRGDGYVWEEKIKSSETTCKKSPALAVCQDYEFQ